MVKKIGLELARKMMTFFDKADKDKPEQTGSRSSRRRRSIVSVQDRTAAGQDAERREILAL